MGFPPPSGGGVASVFTRTGAVTAAAGDYTGVASGSVGIANLALASASTVAITGPGTYFVTGTTAINTVTGAASGCVITLVASGQAAGICVVLNNATTANALNLRDNANLGIYAGESVTFVYNGTYWLESARALKTVLDYQQITASVTGTGAVANVVSASAITFDGATPIRVEMFSPLVFVNAAGVTITQLLYDGVTAVSQLDTQTFGASSGDTAKTLSHRFVPSAASHTYIWKCNGGSGTTQVQAGTGTAGATAPAFIRISRDL